VGQILDALLGAVATINADTGISVGDGAALSVGILGHVFSPSLPGGETRCATEPVEAFQAQQILARLELPPAGRGWMAARERPQPEAGRKREAMQSLFRFLFPYLVLLCFLVFPRAIGEDAVMRANSFVAETRWVSRWQSFRGGACVLMLDV
jgi:hypothetical protein